MKSKITYLNEPSAQAVRNALQVIADALNRQHESSRLEIVVRKRRSGNEKKP